MLPEVNMLKGFGHDFNHFFLPPYVTICDIDIILQQQRPCRSKFVRVLPKFVRNKCTVYANSLDNLVSAMYRQTIANIEPNPLILKGFLEFFNSTILDELATLITGIQVHPKIWYNHLTYSQQVKVSKYFKNPDMDITDPMYYTCMCKSEKQFGDKPKTRCISDACQYDKFLLGPIIYELQQHLRSMKGYAPEMTFEDKAAEYNRWHANGWEIFCLDINGFDRSNGKRLKFKTHFPIYGLIADLMNLAKLCDSGKITRNAFMKRCKIKIKDSMLPDSVKEQCYIIIEATVFSGRSCTTAINTIVMSAIMRYIMEVILGLRPDEYGLMCCGDDSIVGYPSGIPREYLKEIIYQVFAQPGHYTHPMLYPFIQHGIGMQVKFILQGSVQDADFCSTITFYCEVCKKYRLLKKLDKFAASIIYSIKAAGYSEKNFKAYMQAMYVGNKHWINDLPIYTQLNNLLYTGSKDIIDFKDGNKKEKIPLNYDEQLHYEKYYINAYNKDYDKYIKIFGNHDDAYTFAGKHQESYQCCNDALMNRFKTLYGWSINDIQVIIHTLCNMEPTTTIPLLDEGFEYYENTYLTSLKM